MKPQNIKSGISRESHDGVLIVKDAIDATTNEPLPETELHLAIPQEAWKDQQALDWLISNKSPTFDSDKALLNHILESAENSAKVEASKDISLDEIAAELSDASGSVTGGKIQQLIAKYGDEYLQQISDAELLELYKGASK